MVNAPKWRIFSSPGVIGWKKEERHDLETTQHLQEVRSFLALLPDNGDHRMSCADRSAAGRLNKCGNDRSGRLHKYNEI